MLDRSNVSPVSHGPCTQQNNFCNDAAFQEVRGHPVLAPLCAEGCRDDLPSGGCAFRTLTCRLSSFAMAATV